MSLDPTRSCSKPPPSMCSKNAPRAFFLESAACWTWVKSIRRALWETRETNPETRVRPPSPVLQGVQNSTARDVAISFKHGENLRNVNECAEERMCCAPPPREANTHMFRTHARKWTLEARNVAKWGLRPQKLGRTSVSLRRGATKGGKAVLCRFPSFRVTNSRDCRTLGRTTPRKPCSVQIRSTPKPAWSRSGVDLVSILESVWDRSGVILGSSLGKLGVVVGLVGGRIQAALRLNLAELGPRFVESNAPAASARPHGPVCGYSRPTLSQALLDLCLCWTDVDVSVVQLWPPS